MHTDKKITKEDTWRPADLRRHIRESEHVDHLKKKGDNGRKHRGGESTERRHKDTENEFKLEGHKSKEKEHTRGRREEDRGKAGRIKEGSLDRRRDKESDRQKRSDRYESENKYVEDYRENRDLEEDHRDKELHRDNKKEKRNESDGRDDREKREERRKERMREEMDREPKHEKERKKESDRCDDRAKREERPKERMREEMDREHKHEKERRRHERSEEERRDEVGKHHRESGRRRHRDEDDGDIEVQRRHEDRKHSEQRQQREFGDDRKHKEERERRHKEKSRHEERQRHNNEQQGLKGPGEEVRRRHDDREHLDKERRHRDDNESEWKHKERRQKQEEEEERKHRQRKPREEEEAQRRKHKEEEEELKKKPKDRTSFKTSPMDNVNKNVMEAELAKDEEVAYEEYEDDFEDYEDDFEDMDDNEGEDEEEQLHQEEEGKMQEISPQRRKEIEAVQRAIEEENERVGTAQLSRSRSREEEETLKGTPDSDPDPRKASQKGRFMDFVAAKKREVNKQVATKQKKRSTELLRLIDLDYSPTFSLLELQPVNEYDMYIRNFGTANTKQAYVQCNEDNADREIQTEEVEMSEKWTQHPPEQSRACGDPNLSQEVQDEAMNLMKFDSKRLTSFLRSASQVVVVLLEEDRAERNSLRKLKTHTDTLSFSDGSLQLNTKWPFLHGRQISLMHFSEVQRHTMMSVHTPMSKPRAVLLDSCTIICIWNIWEPSRPQKILVYESEVQCCCFSPGKATLVFAGTSVGSVVLWDLREHASNHFCSVIEGEEWTFRQPTFSTDAVMATSGHSSCVTTVEVLHSSTVGSQRLEVPLLPFEEDSSGLSFQLASLDENGVLNFWVVVELSKGNEAGSLTDLGLRPGGKVKLLHSARLQTAERPSPRDVVKTGPIQTLLLKFLPTDCSHFFIGTNMGVVHHRTSHGIKARPKLYRFQEVLVRPVDVSSIQFSPFKPHLFLVGCGNGSVRLHTVGQEQPVAEWADSTAGQPVVSLHWANTRPTVFCVLDAASNIHVWDLLQSNAEPVLTERVVADRVTAMAVFGDSARKRTYSGIALAHESGKLVMQYFTGKLTVCSSAEEEKLESLMTEAI